MKYTAAALTAALYPGSGIGKSSLFLLASAQQPQPQPQPQPQQQQQQQQDDPASPAAPAQVKVVSTTKANKCPDPLTQRSNNRRCRCIPIRDYSDLHGAVRRMDDNECKCFQPFSVTKPTYAPPLTINDRRRIVLRCQERGRCQIQGPGTHLIIRGEESEVTVSGFQFVGATEGAVVIEDYAGAKERGSAVREQIVCDSDFFSNTAESGGAIKVGTRAQAYIANSLFQQNAATRMGGAIATLDGTAHVLDSTFLFNAAALGGAISSNRPTSTVSLAGNWFHSNSASLGPTYGMAVAANGRVNDWGGNDSHPQDFMCLSCTLVPGSRPVIVVEVEEKKEEKRCEVKVNPDANPDDGIDVEYELGRYKRNENEDFAEDYDMYADDGEFGPFNLKLHWEKGYEWQDQTRDLKYCMQSKYSEKRVESKEEPLELYRCDEDEKRQRFYAVGRSIRLDERRDLCLTYVNVRGIELQCCNGSIYQKWDRLQFNGKFVISPTTDHRRCMTNHHHPRNEERIYLEWCHVAKDADTMYWELDEREGDDKPEVITPAPTTADPTMNPTYFPTPEPTISHAPSSAPTSGPSSHPTVSPAPTSTPTASPTNPPTATPTSYPTIDPEVYGDFNFMTPIGNDFEEPVVKDEDVVDLGEETEADEEDIIGVVSIDSALLVPTRTPTAMPNDLYAEESSGFIPDSPIVVTGVPAEVLNAPLPPPKSDGPIVVTGVPAEVLNSPRPPPKSDGPVVITGVPAEVLNAPRPPPKSNGPVVVTGIPAEVANAPRPPQKAEYSIEKQAGADLSDSNTAGPDEKTEDDSTPPASSYSFEKNTIGADSINNDDDLCDDRLVHYERKGVRKTRCCSDPQFIAAASKLCSRGLYMRPGLKVWDVCESQCAEYHELN